MSLSIASKIAYSALSASQVQISVASSNVANAATEGYTTKTATLTNTVHSGTSSGVTVTSISGGVDKLLLKSLTEAESELGAAETTSDYTDRLQTLFGSLTSDTDSDSIASDITVLETALVDLAGSPDSDTLAAAVVTALDEVAAGLRSTSSSIQSLRADADTEIAADVDTVNQALSTIADLNAAIVAGQARGEATGDLEDQRTTALETISGLMDVNWYTTSTGALQVYTSSGVALVDSSVHELSFDPVAEMTADTVTGGITVGGKDITGDIGSGAIGALLTLRDETLPAVQDELDELATGLIEALNAVSNTGTAAPPSTTLTGTTEVAATDGFSASGTTRIALVDDDGALVSYADLDLSAYDTVGDLVTALDAIDGVDASIDADGRLTLSSTVAGAGIAIGTLDGETFDGETFSEAFGLGDVVTGTGAADIRVDAALLADATRLPTAILDETATATGDLAITSGASTLADTYAELFSASTDFAAAGTLSARSSDFAGYASSIVSGVATRASNAASALTTAETIESNLASTISSASGVNLDEETARISDYQTLYSAAAQVIQTVDEMFATLLDMVDQAM